MFPPDDTSSSVFSQINAVTCRRVLPRAHAHQNVCARVHVCRRVHVRVRVCVRVRVGVCVCACVCVCLCVLVFCCIAATTWKAKDMMEQVADFSIRI